LLKHIFWLLSFTDTLEKLVTKIELPSNSNLDIIQTNNIGVVRFNLKSSSFYKPNNNENYIGATSFGKSSNLNLKAFGYAANAAIRSISHLKSAFFISQDQLSKINVTRVFYLVMKETLFNSDRSTRFPNCYMTSLILMDDIKNEQVKSNLSLKLFFNKTDETKKSLCGYWDTKLTSWSTQGCFVKRINHNGAYECICNHTTFFALIAEPEVLTLELTIVYAVLTVISISFASAVIYIFLQKVLKINTNNTAKQPAFYSMISSLVATCAYIMSSLIMVLITFNNQNEVTLSCSLLAAAEQFFLLFYFFWLMITILMNYFTIQFQLENFVKFFKPLVILSISNTLIIFLKF